MTIMHGTAERRAASSSLAPGLAEVVAATICGAAEGPQQGKPQENAFALIELADVVSKLRRWEAELPRVEPFYAVKCNDDASIVATLARLGTGFDCASKGEIEQILALGVSPDRIVYANPCKQPSHLRYAAQAGVAMQTFDNADELIKVKRCHPGAKLLLRIRADDSKSICRLGQKYGAELEQVGPLLRRAEELGLDVCGVSYHVGSGCYDSGAFVDSIQLARDAFDIAAAAGVTLTVLDIGGGFPGERQGESRGAAEAEAEAAAEAAAKHGEGSADGGGTPGGGAGTAVAALPPCPSFEAIAAHLRPALAKHFPPSSGVRIIAEPGRFFVHSCLTLVANVIARRVVKAPPPARDAAAAAAAGSSTQPATEESEPEQQQQPEQEGSGNAEPQQQASSLMYYINDGVYGSFNCLLYDHAVITAPVVLDAEGRLGAASAAEPPAECSVWGPTCDGLDCVLPNAMLPRLEVGSWLAFPNMGAYTLCAASRFNGFELPTRVYIAGASSNVAASCVA